MTKNDLRVIKTKNLLFDTLTILMKENSFERIKVSDICDKALINRSTFYSHYSDKYELLVDYINNLKINLKKALEKNNNIGNTKEYYLELIRLLLDQIDEKKDMYYSILINNRDSIVVDILFEAVSNDLDERIKNEGDIPSEIIVRFYLGAVVSLGLDWINSDKYTKEDIIRYIDLLIPDNLGK